MRAGIVGLPQTGKTTLFIALTSNEIPVHPGKVNTGSVTIFDKDLSYLSKIFNPKKTTYAALQIIDIPGILKGEEHKTRTNELLREVKSTDALIQVVDGFSAFDENLIKEEIDGFNLDLMLLDLEVIENKLSKIKKEKKTPQLEVEENILLKCKGTLENGLLLKELTLSSEEKKTISSYAFYSIIPSMYIINVAGVDQEKLKIKAHLETNLKTDKNPFIIIMDAEIEKEISELNEEEQKKFLEEYGLNESAKEMVIENLYKLLDYETFYTVSENEVKVWTIKKGTKARQAAGKVHSDIERGFIAAEVVSFENFKACGNSLKEAKNKGHLRLEGENYIVKNKDIIHFRFNI